MNTIKFRGKSLSTGEWVYGYYIQGANNKHFIAKSLNVDVIEVDPTTVGHYIGIKDKDGSEICEGDIVRGGFYGRGYENIEVKYFLRQGFEPIQNDEYNVSDSKVIGNIHDNPTLLTQ